MVYVHVHTYGICVRVCTVKGDTPFQWYRDMYMYLCSPDYQILVCFCCCVSASFSPSFLLQLTFPKWQGMLTFFIPIPVWCTHHRTLLLLDSWGVWIWLGICPFKLTTRADVTDN